VSPAATAEAATALAPVADWLAGLFCAPPAPDDIARWQSTEGAALLDAIGAELACGPAIARMRAVLCADAAPASLALDLSAAYARLFTGCDASGTVSPYESHYTGTGRLFDQAMADMGALLHRCGLAIVKDCPEPPDHVAIELALLAALLRDGDVDGVRHIHARLAGWLPAFVDACIARDPHGFYGGAAAVLVAWLDALPDAIHLQQDLESSCRQK